MERTAVQVTTAFDNRAYALVQGALRAGISKQDSDAVIVAPSELPRRRTRLHPGLVVDVVACGITNQPYSKHGDYARELMRVEVLAVLRRLHYFWGSTGMTDSMTVPHVRSRNGPNC